MSLLRLSNNDRHPATAGRSRASRARGQSGFVMIEMMLAVAIVGTAMFAAVSAFSTAARTSAFVQETTTAEWLATSQIELVRTAAFLVTPATYTDVATPAGYSIANVTSGVGGADSNIQIVTVTVTRGGEDIYVTSTMKVNR